MIIVKIMYLRKKHIQERIIKHVSWSLLRVFFRKREYTEKSSRSGKHVGKLQEACSRALSTKIQAVSHAFIQNTAAVPSTGDLWEMWPSHETLWQTINVSQIHRKQARVLNTIKSTIKCPATPGTTGRDDQRKSPHWGELLKNAAR